MESYSIEDIELLRKKSGMSYQEAVALLDYHNGDLARALIDLEKSGRLREESNKNMESTAASESNTRHGEAGKKALNILQKLYRSRIKVSKGDTTVVNLSVLFGGACLLLAPHMTIAGIIISMLLGYKFSFSSMDAVFSSDSLEKMVRNAAQNAKSSVSSVVQSFSSEKKDVSWKAASSAQHGEEMKETPVNHDKQPAGKTPAAGDEDDPAVSLKKQTEEIEKTLDSFFDSNPAATTYHSAYSAAASSVPTIQVPVQAETREGTVQIDNDHDGFSSVTIG